MTRCIANRWIAAAMITFALTSPAHAIITHAGEELAEGSLPAGFDPDWVGRWAGNASAIAIAPQFAITTRHQSGGINTQVVFGGTTYKVIDETFLNDDLRVVQLAHLNDDPANLSAYVPVYSGNTEVGHTAIIGGYGKGRGADLINGDTVHYGYQWASEGNTTRRWGQNRIELIVNFVDEEDVVVFQGIRADFDRFDASVGESKVSHEAIPAEFDSGGGWFINNGGQWEVAGLTLGVEHGNLKQAWFRNDITGAIDPDVMDAIRLSPYADQINQIIPEPAGLTLLAGAGALAMLRRRGRR